MPISSESRNWPVTIDQSNHCAIRCDEVQKCDAFASASCEFRHRIRQSKRMWEMYVIRVSVLLPLIGIIELIGSNVAILECVWLQLWIWVWENGPCRNNIIDIEILRWNYMIESKHKHYSYLNFLKPSSWFSNALISPVRYKTYFIFELISEIQYLSVSWLFIISCSFGNPLNGCGRICE